MRTGARARGGLRLKGNVAEAIGNWLADRDQPPEQAVAVLRDALEGEEALVRERAGWALERASHGDEKLGG